ncbi:hypothetical protein BSKO_12386 [Bryopsis sp. KO-2023]|nr:hypothetical protein BSKO_12386 [Bryopsis sp. KO-2023]
MALDSPRDGSLLSFRVLRLSKPQINLTAPERVDLARDVREGGTLSPLIPESRSEFVPEEAFARRVECRHPADLFGVDGSIELARDIGEVYLGETISCYASLGNYSNQVVSLVDIKAEMQSERSRSYLFQNSTPLPGMAPGVKRDFTIKFDVKELGSHTLICTSQYTSQDGDRKICPQYFRFSASSPLSLRTKVRPVAGDIFLEACLENAKSGPLILEYVRFDPSKAYTVASVDQHPESITSGPLKDYINSLKIVQPNKGTRNFLFKFSPTESTSSSVESASADERGVLGKMEIKWKGALGEIGRLQTQLIKTGGSSGQKDIQGQVIKMNDSVPIFDPFEVTVRIRNTTVRALGPLSLVLKPANNMKAEEMPVLMDGLQSILLNTLPPHKSCDVACKMIAVQPGVHTINGFSVIHQTDGFGFGSIDPVQIFVDDVTG